MAKNSKSPAPRRAAARPAPQPVDQLFAQGLACHEKGQLAPAGTFYEQVLQLRPRHFDALNNLGLIRKQGRDYKAALDLLDRAIEANPEKPEAHNNRGNVLRELKRLDDALQSYDRAIALRPGYAEAHHNRGIALKGLRQFEAALASYARAIALKPAHVESYSEQGNVLKELRQFDAALRSYDKAIELKPDYAEAWSNRGVVQKELRQFDAALQSYDRAVAIRPDYTEAHWNRSLLNLVCGRLDAGWPGYEWRWQEGGHCHAERRAFDQPRWLGDTSLEGRTILLYAEQGLGDTLQFCRYATMLAGRGARVILEVQRPLVALLRGLAGVSAVVGRGDDLPAFDCHCPLLSLPLAFGTDLQSIPSPGPYLTSDAGKRAEWESRLGRKSGPRIGVVWSGSTIHNNDRNRSIPLADFVGLSGDDCQFVALQKEIRATDQAVLASLPRIRTFCDELNDFTDTAALCDLMDVVISVDTSVAHLAAALGRTVWILLPATPDWRWLLDREDSPWYRTVRLYRQKTAGDWSEVLGRIRRDLQALPGASVASPATPGADASSRASITPAPALSCPVCTRPARLFDVVDFNKSCAETKGSFLPLSGRPVYYARCENCGFAFAPEFAAWSDADFRRDIYNAAYVDVDPEYPEQRPRKSARYLAQLLGAHKSRIRHLDYGGGNGLLSRILAADGWDSTSYDPFADTSGDPDRLGRFNLISAFEVFEHVPDPRRLMHNLKALMDDECLVVFTTLVSDGVLLPGQRLTWWYASPRNGHISLFSRKSLEILAGEHGLRFVSINNGVHLLANRVPAWAAHLVPPASK